MSAFGPEDYDMILERTRVANEATIRGTRLRIELDDGSVWEGIPAGSMLSRRSYEEDYYYCTIKLTMGASLEPDVEAHRIVSMEPVGPSGAVEPTAAGRP